MTVNHCTKCTYFLIETNAQMGSCRRYPTYQNRHSTEWCGEFLSAVAEKATLTVGSINLPAVFSDLPDTIENLVAEAERREGLDIAKPVDIPAKRKPGRPKLSGRQIP